ncbi:hypothetical protein J4H86_22000 [Spiractinospora alimapuensis]|uniref:hypothetical protein n=1 Tax=Spiractinospora alimapuensis TaxID=2820884 RepID=UPI001F1ADA58|nr:hypothetical protein [Spiractinospora alimapuensis]QVQ51445.1 hypothetical protein J4H86_22000 [Spiractinospora alimapuensis]
MGVPRISGGCVVVAAGLMATVSVPASAEELPYGPAWGSCGSMTVEVGLSAHYYAFPTGDAEQPHLSASVTAQGEGQAPPGTRTGVRGQALVEIVERPQGSAPPETAEPEAELTVPMEGDGTSNSEGELLIRLWGDETLPRSEWDPAAPAYEARLVGFELERPALECSMPETRTGPIGVGPNMYPTPTEAAQDAGRGQDMDADLAIVLVAGSVTVGATALAWFLVRTRRRGAGRSR